MMKIPRGALSLVASFCCKTSHPRLAGAGSTNAAFLPLQLGVQQVLDLNTDQQRSLPSFRLFSSSPTSSAHNHNDEETKTLFSTFPRRLHLTGYANVSQRLAVTMAVAEVLNKQSNTGDGFISHSNLLSDLATVLIVEDMDTTKLDNLLHALQSINGLTLAPATSELLKECSRFVANSSSDNSLTTSPSITIPSTVTGVIQLLWKNAQGKLTHEIPADG